MDVICFLVGMAGSGLGIVAALAAGYGTLPPDFKANLSAYIKLYATMGTTQLRCWAADLIPWAVLTVRDLVLEVVLWLASFVPAGKKLPS